MLERLSQKEYEDLIDGLSKSLRSRYILLPKTWIIRLIATFFAVLCALFGVGYAGVQRDARCDSES